MFGTNKPTNTTIKTRADHLAEMRKAIDAATSAAEDNGVFARQIRDVFEASLNYWRRRALYQSDLANRDRPEHVAAVALTQVKSLEAERLASEREWQASVDRRAAEQAVTDEWRR